MLIWLGGGKSVIRTMSYHPDKIATLA
jgi:hypothetical protein